MVQKLKNKKCRIINNDLYCRYLTPDEFDSGLNNVIQLAKTPGVIPDRPKTELTMKQIINKIPKFEMHHRTNGFDNLEILQSADSISVPTVKAIGLPCLQKIAQKPNPTHYERIELVSWLKAMGYRDVAIVAFIKRLKWQNFSYKDTVKNVASITGRYPKCTWLRDIYPESCDKCSLRKL